MNSTRYLEPASRHDDTIIFVICCLYLYRPFQLAGTPHEPNLRLLELFAYGTYSEAMSKADELPKLTPVQVGSIACNGPRVAAQLAPGRYCSLTVDTVLGHNMYFYASRTCGNFEHDYCTMHISCGECVGSRQYSARACLSFVRNSIVVRTL